MTAADNMLQLVLNIIETLILIIFCLNPYVNDGYFDVIKNRVPKALKALKRLRISKKKCELMSRPKPNIKALKIN